MTPKNINKIFIPQKIFIFLKTPKNIEIQNFEPPKIDPSLRMYESIRVPPPSPGPKQFSKTCVKRILKSRPNIDLYDK